MLVGVFLCALGFGGPSFFLVFYWCIIDGVGWGRWSFVLVRSSLSGFVISAGLLGFMIVVLSGFYFVCLFGGVVSFGCLRASSSL